MEYVVTTVVGTLCPTAGTVSVSRNESVTWAWTSTPEGFIRWTPSAVPEPSKRISCPNPDPLPVTVNVIVL